MTFNPGALHDAYRNASSEDECCKATVRNMLLDFDEVTELETLDELDFMSDLIVASSWRDPVVWCNLVTAAAAVTVAALLWRRR